MIFPICALMNEIRSGFFSIRSSTMQGFQAQG